MIRRIILGFLAFPLGGWMLFDGIHVLTYGKYFGPERPGPWSLLIVKIGVDPFSLGPLFILYGLLWLVFPIALLSGRSWGRTGSLLLAIATLWYLPFGTLTAILYIILLNVWKSRLR